MIETVQRLYRLLISAASSMQSPFLLAVRLYWGWLFVQTGRGKLNNLEKVTQFFIMSVSDGREPRAGRLRNSSLSGQPTAFGLPERGCSL